MGTVKTQRATLQYDRKWAQNGQQFKFLLSDRFASGPVHRARQQDGFLDDRVLDFFFARSKSLSLSLLVDREVKHVCHNLVLVAASSVVDQQGVRPRPRNLDNCHLSVRSFSARADFHHPSSNIRAEIRIIKGPQAAGTAALVFCMPPFHHLLTLLKNIGG